MVEPLRETFKPYVVQQLKDPERTGSRHRRILTDVTDGAERAVIRRDIRRMHGSSKPLWRYPGGLELVDLRPVGAWGAVQLT
jgi:hypothetical protein